MLIHSDWRMTTLVTMTDLEQLMPAGFHLELKEKQHVTYTVLDDYDWSVWSAGLVLFRSGARTLCLQRPEGEPLVNEAVADSVRFWWELPAGELAAQLQKLIGLRAFTAKFSVCGDDQHIAVLNDDDKTVARLQLIRLGQAEQAESQLLSLQALRGYEEETQLITAALQRLPHVDVPPLILRQQLLQVGLTVEKPLSKPDFRLKPDEFVEPAVTRMIAQLFALAREQEAGLVADVDSEFVHQYRVNIRKARSLVSLFKRIYSPARYRQLNEALKDLGKRTNELRDLDVFLIDCRVYPEMLPDNLRPGLNQLVERLRRRRRTVFRKVRNQLVGHDYDEQVITLQSALQQEPDYATARAHMPLKQLVCHKINKQYRAIVKDGALIGDDTPDQAVHALRIKCKKLRYLLELFAELFCNTAIKPLIKQLKLLQDNLGQFNDFVVQREFLGRLAHRRQISDEQLATIHGLQAVLFDRQRQERSQVVANISKFSDAEVFGAFSRVFACTTQEPDQE